MVSIEDKWKQSLVVRPRQCHMSARGWERDPGTTPVVWIILEEPKSKRLEDESLAITYLFSSFSHWQIGNKIVDFL